MNIQAIVFLCAVCISCSKGVAQREFTINPNGVWNYPANLNNAEVRTFSWGENPTPAVCFFAIDLGAKPPAIWTCGMIFTVARWESEGLRITFQGYWGSDRKRNGSIETVFAADGLSLYIAKVVPEEEMKAGADMVYVRVPKDAPVRPVSEEGP